MRRTWSKACVSLCASLVIAGCAGIPTSGPVKTGAALQGINDSGVIRVIARPPVSGASPTQIVQGFLSASATLNDFSVAQQYLTPFAKQSWNPSGVTVIRGAIQVSEDASSTVVVSGPLDGVVDQFDRWQVAPQGQRFSANFALTKVDGQWRIASLPDGVIISRTAADRSLRSYDVLFLDPSLSILVPDPITVATSAAGLATTLVRRLLEGPSAWLAPAVTTAIPDGTRLALESVPIIGGTAQVQLTEEVLAANSRARSALSAQIVRTLAPVPGVQSVSITVGGAPLAGVGLEPVAPVSAFAQFGPDFVSSTNLFSLVAGQPSSITVIDGAVTTRGSFNGPLLELDVSRDAKTWVAISERRDLVVSGITEQPGAVVYRGANFASPQVVGSALWVVQRGIGIVAINDNQARPIPVSDIGGQSLDESVLALRVSRDRTRAALIVRDSGRSRLVMARVETTGGTVRLVAAKRIENTVADVLDVAWQGSSRLAVLEQSGTDTRLVTLALGLASPQVIDVPLGATRVAAAPGRTVIVEVPAGASSTLYLRSSGRWTPLLAAQAPVYP